MMRALDELKVYLRASCVKHGHFVLSSGRESDFYVNCKPAITKPSILRTIVGLMAHHLALTPDRPYGFAPVPNGGTPIATALCLQEDLPLVLVQHLAKAHGTKKRVETCTIGQYKPSIVLIEDVVTSGASVLRTAQVLIEEGFSPVGVLAIIDREEGGERALLDAGLWFRSIFRRSDFDGTPVKDIGRGGGSVRPRDQDAAGVAVDPTVAQDERQDPRGVFGLSEAAPSDDNRA